jgi:anaerobic selenocysteine-containing dehydrogenase
VRSGTNQALLNAIVHELIAHDWVDRAYIDAHTLGYDDLARTVEQWGPDQAAAVCDVDAGAIRAGAELVGTSERLLSTVLQGVYQSHQATAAACNVNNIHLLRGMIGRPGAGVLQMNGQPTAQNTRETGADGDLPGFRNWDDPDHVDQLATLWDVDPMVIPHWAPPTHALQIWRYAEMGSIDLLWIAGTNPAVSLPDVERTRAILEREDLFVVAQDIFPTETTALADVVLPAAAWGEKIGCFTNADRTVHLSERAVDPPGEARSDLDIWLDLARRLDLRTRSGGPLIGWSDASGAFDAWAECSRGRPCDYSGLSHDRLRGAPGIQWPCDADRPDGTARLYTDGHFATTPGDAEDFGHDLATGAVVPPDEYKARRPDGRAFLRAAPYEPAPEPPDDAHPLHLATGRTVHHFHTRTKTGRTPELEAAAPEPWVELHPDDAAERGLADGDTVRVESATGAVEVPLRITGIRPGVVFLPFHYGWWDDAGHDPAGGRVTAANALVAVRWDPVSKQPAFKVGAVTVTTTGG